MAFSLVVDVCFTLGALEFFETALASLLGLLDLSLMPIFRGKAGASVVLADLGTGRGSCNLAVGSWFASSRISRVGVSLGAEEGARAGAIAPSSSLASSKGFPRSQKVCTSLTKKSCTCLHQEKALRMHQKGRPLLRALEREYW